ncbi:nuclear transport factor 2 family protein [Sphingobacterium sp. JB170]|uniref:nuclear transport factor 2 family protein n=1 Tax=Sphingobacterium sp. JB170 TaxID=1434842 RepID=UPI00211B39D1|nr:nuclear transport factor 2 family protein [Sphingobacterium sp. JB170]
MATTKELIEQINRLFTENRMEAFMDYLAEDVVWDMYTASSGRTTFNGKAELSQMDGSDMPEHTNFQFSTIVIEGDRASVQGLSTNKKADGTEYESNFCDIYQFKDDKVVRMGSYVVDNIK